MEFSNRRRQKKEAGLKTGAVFEKMSSAVRKLLQLRFCGEMVGEENLKDSRRVQKYSRGCGDWHARNWLHWVLRLLNWILEPSLHNMPSTLSTSVCKSE